MGGNGALNRNVADTTQLELAFTSYKEPRTIRITNHESRITNHDERPHPPPANLAGRSRSHASGVPARLSGRHGGHVPGRGRSDHSGERAPRHRRRTRWLCRSVLGGRRLSARRHGSRAAVWTSRRSVRAQRMLFVALAVFTLASLGVRWHRPSSARLARAVQGLGGGGLMTSRRPHRRKRAGARAGPLSRLLRGAVRHRQHGRASPRRLLDSAFHLAIRVLDQSPPWRAGRAARARIRGARSTGGPRFISTFPESCCSRLVRFPCCSR